MMCRCCRELGDTFKWLFYGDDDTMWLRPNPDLLVQTYAANTPHVLTGGPGLDPSCCCLAAIAGSTSAAAAAVWRTSMKA